MPSYTNRFYHVFIIVYKKTHLLQTAKYVRHSSCYFVKCDILFLVFPLVFLHWFLRKKIETAGVITINTFTWGCVQGRRAVQGTKDASSVMLLGIWWFNNTELSRSTQWWRRYWEHTPLHVEVLHWKFTWALHQPKLITFAPWES